MKKAVLRYKTIVLSDVHLGTADCKAKEANHFLKHTRCDTLILNGDIIDGWSLSRKGGWEKEHTKFIRLILKKMEKQKTNIVYLRGNHDDLLGKFLPIAFDRFQLVEEYVHTNSKGRYLCIHGDVFDSVTQNHRFLAVIGDVGYQGLLKINRLYNKYRAWRGKGYYSLSKAIKARVKEAVNHISDFEDHLKDLARKRECTGIVCGHIHTPADKMMDDIHYLNSGDWVESMTALVEHEDGNFEVLAYPEFCRRLQVEEQELARKAARKKEKKEAAKAGLAEGPLDDAGDVTFPRGSLLAG